MNAIMRILTGIGAAAGAFALYLLAVALAPGFPKPRYQLAHRGSTMGEDGSLPEAPRLDVCFDVAGTSIKAWLYLPKDRATLVPCVVMAHGLGGTRAMGLARYAAHFQSAGFAALVFDYRCWGDSEGEPRGLIWIPHQLEDYAAAIEYARSREEIDPARIALWGTSMSGGHVVAMAAQDHRIACAVAQCPLLDGLEATRMAFIRMGGDLRIVVHAQRDLARSWLGLSPHKIPVVGKPGEVALMTAPDAVVAFEQLAPAGYANEACARIALRIDKYRPVRRAHMVRCPILLQICEHDDTVPNEAVEKTAAILGELAEVRRYPIGHFDAYQGEPLRTSLDDQAAFLTRHLLAPPAAAREPDLHDGLATAGRG